MMTPKDGYCQSDVDPYITSTLYILVRSNIATISMEFHTGACTAVQTATGTQLVKQTHEQA